MGDGRFWHDSVVARDGHRESDYFVDFYCQEGSSEGPVSSSVLRDAVSRNMSRDGCIRTFSILGALVLVSAGCGDSGGEQESDTGETDVVTFDIGSDLSGDLGGDDMGDVGLDSGADTDAEDDAEDDADDDAEDDAEDDDAEDDADDDASEDAEDDAGDDADDDAGDDDADDDVGDDADAVADATDEPDGELPPYNTIFVSSVPFEVGRGGLSTADSFCQERARAARLRGTFVALLSTETVDARDRVGTARGWVRTDGLPFADRLTEPGQILHPPLLDEFGESVGPVWTFTASENDGTYSSLPGGHCGNWTSTEGNARIGLPDTTAEWLDGGTLSSCATPLPIYCASTDYVRPLTDLSEWSTSGLMMFVSSTPSASDFTMRSADATCQADAEAASLDGNFRALLAVAEETAASRFPTVSRLRVVRPDGLMVASSVPALMEGDLIAPPAMRADGTPYTFRVWTGAGNADVAGDTSGTCDDWTDANPELSGWMGMAYGTLRQTSLVPPRSNNRWWFGNDRRTCSTGTAPVYCLQTLSL